jgi:hypothetical protein
MGNKFGRGSPGVLFFFIIILVHTLKDYKSAVKIYKDREFMKMLFLDVLKKMYNYSFSFIIFR